MAPGHLPFLYATSRDFSAYLAETSIAITADVDDDSVVDVDGLIDRYNCMRWVLRLPLVHAELPLVEIEGRMMRVARGAMFHLRPLRDGEPKPTFDFGLLPTEAVLDVATIKSMVASAPYDSWTSPGFVQDLGEYWFDRSNLVQFRDAVCSLDRSLPDAAKYFYATPGSKIPAIPPPPAALPPPVAEPPGPADRVEFRREGRPSASVSEEDATLGKPARPKGGLDERAAAEVMKNPALTYKQLATILGCNASSLRNQARHPLLAKARTAVRATRLDYRAGATWRDHPDDA